MTETCVYKFILVFLKRKKKEMNKKREIGVRRLSKKGFFCHVRLKQFEPVVEENYLHPFIAPIIWWECLNSDIFLSNMIPCMKAQLIFLDAE